jgi:SAM-dependent methyltransferase
MAEEHWPVRLFNKSVLKQTKFNQIVAQLGDTTHMHCLDIGSDNGVFSYLLRQRGGSWKSADIDDRSVAALRELVQTDVYQIDGGRTPFEENEFDCVVIVDFLEHIPNDVAFMDEVYRILKPSGTLIFNTPNLKPGFLDALRNRLGLTDEAHGHLRPGYDRRSILALLGDRFELQSFNTYTRFFSKFTDVLMAWGLTALKRRKQEKGAARGVLVVGEDLKDYQKMFRVYSFVYPLVWLFTRLDALLFFRSGYMLIGKARSAKPSTNGHGGKEWQTIKEAVATEARKSYS